MGNTLLTLLILTLNSELGNILNISLTIVFIKLLVLLVTLSGANVVKRGQWRSFLSIFILL